jgi:hypothetical protein
MLLAGHAQADDLAKTSQNPVANIISLRLEVWHYSGIPKGADAGLYILEPVYPVTVGSLNLINSLIVPSIDLDGPGIDVDLGSVEIPENPGRNGWGNIQYQAFLTPAQPRKLIFGPGPVFDFPTHTRGWARTSSRQLLRPEHCPCRVTGYWRRCCRTRGHTLVRMMPDLSPK